MPIFSSTIEYLTANTMPRPYYRFDGSNDEIAIADTDILSFGDGTVDSPFSIEGTTKIGTKLSDHLALTRESVDIYTDGVKVGKITPCSFSGVLPF